MCRSHALAQGSLCFPDYRQWVSETRGCTLQRRLCTAATVFFGRKCVKTDVNLKSPEVSAYSQIADFSVTNFTVLIKNSNINFQNVIIYQHLPLSTFSRPSKCHALHASSTSAALATRYLWNGFVSKTQHMRSGDTAGHAVHIVPDLNVIHSEHCDLPV